MKSTLYIDIETIPGPESGKDAITVKPPGNMTKQETIDKWFVEKGEKAKDDIYRKQSFNGGYGQICSLSFAVDDGQVFGYKIQTRADEKEGLEMAISQISLILSDVGNPNPVLCGHYISGFDLKFIMHRCIIHGILVPTWMRPHAKPWDVGIRDTTILWAGARDTIGLDELCGILGLEGKTGMTGKDVYDYWLAGKHDEISEYCNSDVEKVRQINKIFEGVGI